MTEWARRVRELRTEGWRIATHNDRNDLAPGQYVCAKVAEPGYVFSKPISGALRAQVLERNGYTCQMCGAGAGDEDPQNPERRVRLHIGHILDRNLGGQDILSNLRALCSSCNQGAKNLVTEPPGWVWLLGQIRRAGIADQRKALEWLKQKFDEP